MADELFAHGVDLITTRGQLIPTSRGRNGLFVAAATSEKRVFAVVTFVVTRVAPVRAHYDGLDPDLGVAA